MDTAQVTDGPVGEGTGFYDQTRLGRLDGVVTDFAPPTKVAFCQTLRWKGTRVFESRPSYVLEPVDGTTAVHHHAEGELYGPFKVLEPLVWAMARVERKRTVDVLRQSLEDHPG